MTTKTVLVTGASRGIGRATAFHLAKSGYDLALHCHSQASHAEAVKDSVESLGRRARVLQFDVSDRHQAEQVLNHDMEMHGAYFGVVCNAGIACDGAFPALSGDEWDTVLSTNLDGFYNVLNPIVMPMIRRREPGRIVTVSSIAGEIGNRGQVNYSASKAGVIGATKALAVELGKRDITVNCVSPGLVETDMVDGESVSEDIIKMIPANRIGKPEEVAAAISFLMSDEAAYITRQVISVNGGMC